MKESKRKIITQSKEPKKPKPCEILYTVRRVKGIEWELLELHFRGDKLEKTVSVRKDVKPYVTKLLAQKILRRG